MVGGGDGDGGSRARENFQPELVLCSVAVITLLGGGVRSQVAGAEALKFGSEPTQLPSSVSSTPFPTLTPLLQRGAAREQEGPVQAFGKVWSTSCGSLAVIRDLDWL